jgi:hemoglobin
MKKLARLGPSILCTVLVLFTGTAAVEAAEAPPGGTPSLYKRLGGYDAIAAVTDDFVAQLVTHPTLGKFFVGHGNDSKMKIRQRVVEKICAATGGPCYYTGRDLKTAHAGLGITEADFDLAGKMLAATLDKFKVPAKEKDELMALVVSFKGDVVGAPAVKP